MRYSTQSPLLPQIHVNRVFVFGLLIVAALLSFEIFNFSTTEFALRDLLGGLRFAGIPWATILAIAFCGIDFAGLARMFTPETGANEPREVWYLFGAWMLAAIMNALLTWWGVSIAVSNHEALGSGIIPRRTMLQGVPIFVAIMVWLIRVLIIGTFSATGDKLFGNQVKARGFSTKSQSETWQPRTQAQSARSLAKQQSYYNRETPISYNGSNSRPVTSYKPMQSTMNTVYNPAPRTTEGTPPEPDTSSDYESTYAQAEPVYIPVGMRGRSSGSHNQVRK